jgi:hypothetical protein
MREQKKVTIQIADLVFSVTSDWPVNIFELSRPYREFLCSGKPEIIINVKYNNLPKISLVDKEKIFDSQTTWSLYGANEQNIFVLKDAALGGPFLIAFFDASFKIGLVHRLLRESEGSLVEGFLSHPLDYPLGEVLMICLLARGRGLMVHACGIDDGGCGYLFLGNSSHGKSTMAKLWYENQATILNDDRAIVREKDGELWMYGTPWHGTFNKVSPQALRIHKVFFLRHGEKNLATPKNGAEAVSMLLARAFPPLWDQKGMDYTLSLLDLMASKLPCYELHFLPDKRITDFIRNI